MSNHYYEDEYIECYFETVGHIFYQFWVNLYWDMNSTKKKGNKKNKTKKQKAKEENNQ